MLKGSRAPPFFTFFSFFILLFYLKFFDCVLHLILPVFGLNSTVLGLNSTVGSLNSTVLVFFGVIFGFELHGFWKGPLLIIKHLWFLSCEKGFELHGKNTMKKRYFLVFIFLFVDKSVDKQPNILKNNCFNLVDKSIYSIAVILKSGKFKFI